MKSRSMENRRARPLKALASLAAAATIALAVTAGCGGGSSSSSNSGLPLSKATLAQVQRGQYLVTTYDCGDCHSQGTDDTSDPNWLAGYIPGTSGQPFNIGPFKTYPANITPDVATGLGGVTDRQVYNVLKYGLQPTVAPNAVITSTTPGVGNFPAAPQYLAPPMPWPYIRHYSDNDLWAIVAYIKHGIKAVSNNPPNSQAPPDYWAANYSNIGSLTIPAYPSGNEQFSP